MIKIGIPTFISCLLLGISAVNADDMELKHRPLPLTIAQLDQITAGAFSFSFDYDSPQYDFPNSKSVSLSIEGAEENGELTLQVTKYYTSQTQIQVSCCETKSW